MCDWYWWLSKRTPHRTVRAESSGKTTVALQAVAETQKSGGYVAYIDAENSLDIEYAENLGVKPKVLSLHNQIQAKRPFI
ncbi:hypothetical protein P9166_08465 [Lactococcus lactis]|nr:hypothetical protein P9166_08465 [Lactococcus lactis]